MIRWQAPDAPALLLHADGNATFSLDQRHYGGRWVYLGDFNFNAGPFGITPDRGSIHPAASHAHLIRRGAGQNARFIIYAGTALQTATTASNAIKVSKWPDCNGVPGTFCNYGR